MNRRTLAEIKQEIGAKAPALHKIHAARMQTRGYNAVPLAAPAPPPAAVAPMVAAPVARRSFKMVAQGDSWFDYPIGKDIIDCLHSDYGHTIVNLAVAGSTLNDEAYGPVPSEMFGLPFGLPQSDDPSRIAELVHRIAAEKPQALLLSAGGNDVAGDEFFSFINNALSGLPAVNAGVLTSVVNDTFKTGYDYLVSTAMAAANDVGIPMKIFTHGYDYPWPDGRAAVSFLGYKIGPWFDPTFNHKNYPNTSAQDLDTRRAIIRQFIDVLNTMLQSFSVKYPGKVFHVDLRQTLATQVEWANELHPTNDGFAKLAAKIDAALQANM